MEFGIKSIDMDAGGVIVETRKNEGDSEERRRGESKAGQVDKRAREQEQAIASCLERQICSSVEDNP